MSPPDPGIAAQADGCRILHLGLGSFHRAHQAWYLNRLPAVADPRWVLAGGNLRPDGENLLRALAAQGGEYTLETVAPNGERTYERIRSIGTVIQWDPGLRQMIELGAQAQTRIISFTVTEAGYHLNNQDGLDLASRELASDLGGNSCNTIYGAVAAILAQRMARNGGAVTLLNCDNLRSNGDRFRRWLLAFLAHQGNESLRDWVDTQVSCPNSMVDRITPRPVPALHERVLAATGIRDEAPVMSEAYMQWVIEDRFPAGRPAWEQAGVTMVHDVMPYEEAKIRILNGSHSCIAWAGSLRGHGYIHEAVADPVVRQLAFDYISDEVIPCLQPSPLNLGAYRDIVLQRFGNPFIEDSLERVAADSFAKLPGYIVPTMRERLGRGLPIHYSSRLAALFFMFLQRWREGGIAFTYADQAMDQGLVDALFSDAAPLPRFCSLPALWGELAGDHRLAAAVQEAHQDLSYLLPHDGSRVGALASLR